MPFQTIIIHLLVFVFLGGIAEPISTKDPGFKEAAFDAKTIQDLLDKTNCDGIRFYNTLEGSSVHLMAIPISKGADMNSGIFNWRPYVVSTGMDEGGILIDKVSDSNARDYCEALSKSSYAFYSADFNKSEVEKILKHERANAVRVTPLSTSEGLTMQMESVHFERGALQSIGSGIDYQIDAIDPCPPLCGEDDDYIYRP